MAAIDFSKFTSILSGIKKILKITNTGVASNVPTPLLLVGAPKRPGLSAVKLSNRIIQRKSDAGLPIGTLPSGTANPDEIMIRIMCEELIKMLQEDGVIQIAIPPGTTLSAAGASAAGPVTVLGSTITMTKGYGVIS
jgi:hypothetical protein